MTIYGEWNDQFRPRPKKWALTIFSASALLIAVACCWALLSVLNVLATETRTSDSSIPLYAPLAQKSSVFREGTNASGAGRALIAPTAAMVLAVLIITVVPTSTRLSSRLAVHAASIACLLYAWSRAFELRPARWLEGELSFHGLWRPLTLIIGYALFDFAERRRNELLGNNEPTATPVQRIRLWVACVGVPLVLLSLLSLMTQYRALLFASLLALGVTAFVNLARRPAQRYEKLKGVELREAAFAAPVIALVVAGACLWLFGMPILGAPHRALLVGTSGARFASLKEIDMSLTAVREAEVKKEAEKKQQEEEKKQVIDIRWSKKK